MAILKSKHNIAYVQLSSINVASAVQSIKKHLNLKVAGTHWHSRRTEKTNLAASVKQKTYTVGSVTNGSYLIYATTQKRWWRAVE